MPRIDLSAIAQTNATGYPPPFDEAVRGRNYRRLAPAVGFTRMGASHVVLEPGAWSSQRHWHAEEDELLIMLEGEAVLVEDTGETVMRPGDIAAWPAGVENGHHLQNRTGAPCVFVAISAGDRVADSGEYPDIDMTFSGEGYFHKDGTPYPAKRAR
ncbi:cupin domain-containing protein [Erythrobacter sp. LQ02-29]|uniref:cupin domain-containing protein n=1 Tax=Erythrobacter sp. LQ02-29 TaxID=2920384 RepID=UPI001F4D9D83|nr:cupin domain-containing protein [Erythrobacter sp. LQ02-29]